MHKVTTECLIKAAHLMKIDSELLHKLERRIALMLESCKATDLLVKSSVTLLDVDIIAKVG